MSEDKASSRNIGSFMIGLFFTAVSCAVWDWTGFGAFQILMSIIGAMFIVVALSSEMTNG